MPISTLCLVLSGLLWGTGGLIGTLFGRAAGLSAMSVAAYRLLAGGGVIVAFLTMTGKRPPAGRAAWTRIAVIGLLSGLFQSCYFAAIALTSVSLATLVTIGGTPVIVAVVEHARDRRALDRAGTITAASASGRASPRPGCWPRSGPARPPSPTRCTSAVCGGRPRAPRPCCRSSSRSPPPCSRRWCSGTG
jgi:hypothetical protein